MRSYLGFRGDPMAMVSEISDPFFVEAPVFTATMRLLGGINARDPRIVADLRLAEQAAEASPSNEAVQCHLDALRYMARSEVSQAARVWDTASAIRPSDVLAIKCSHEAYFLVGDSAGMLRSAEAAIQRVRPDDPVFHVIAGQLSFALEETGRLDEAEGWGRLALESQPDDLWALHALAHVYETANRHIESMRLLTGYQPTWSEQSLLSVHIWWHLALRLLEAGNHGEVLQLFDTKMADTPSDSHFRLTDGTSILWRLELKGIDVGDRWRSVAQSWAPSADTLSNAFLCLHAALAFSRSRDETVGLRFLEAVGDSPFPEGSELDGIHREVTVPLVTALLTQPRSAAAANVIAGLAADLSRIGGSIAQREVVEQTALHWWATTGELAVAAAHLDAVLSGRPNTAWALNARADLAAKRPEVDPPDLATVLRRRAGVMTPAFP